MLISTDIELRKFLPSSVIKDVKTIAMLIERAEDAHLRPVLGDSLYDHILQLHEKGVTDKTDHKTFQLVTLCQSAALYFAMADNVGLLSVSYNTGGGFSIVSTDGYAPADEKEKDRLERDLWKNAWRDIDRLLDLLEADAKSEKPEYAQLWYESEWFYHQGDLLLSTAKEAKRYVTGEEAKTFDRKRFVEMQGDLRFCQMSFISKSIGDDFLEWIVQYNYKNTAVPDVSVGSPDGIPNDKVVRKTKELLSMALMAAMRYRRDHRGADENDANLALFRATEYIKQHQDDFGEIIKTSNLYTPPKTEEEETCKGHRRHKRVAHCECLEGNGEALFVPFL